MIRVTQGQHSTLAQAKSAQFLGEGCLMVQATRRTCMALVLGMVLGAVVTSLSFHIIPSGAAQASKSRQEDSGNERIAFNVIDDPLDNSKVPTFRKPSIVFILTDNLGYGEPGWVFYPIGKIVSEFQESLRKEPPIPPGTADPYQPRRPE